MISKVIQKLRDANILLHRYGVTDPSMEIIYRELFLRELALAGLSDDYYPVGGAANHGFLYLIARLLREFTFSGILELGAGQSSLLLSRLIEACHSRASVLTIEHEAFWARHIQDQVQHKVALAPLAPDTLDGHTISFYDLSRVEIPQATELFLIDGPPAHDVHIKYARLGAFRVVCELLRDDFVIIVDDTERAGEARLAELFLRELTRRRAAFKSNTVRASRCQTIIAGGRYIAAAYF